MSKIYDNQKVSFFSGLTNALDRSYRSDICTAYFNLRIWKKIADFIDKYKGNENHQCRLLLGMYDISDQLKEELIHGEQEKSYLGRIDNKRAKILREETVKDLRNQLMQGVPSNKDENALRRLVKQIKEKKVIIKCFTRNPLHAKLYLTFNEKEFAKKIGFLGSSNLTYSGLNGQGELNIDVLDQEACKGLSDWFQEKWEDQFSLDISEYIIEIIDKSWASENLIDPYKIYIKMAYHLSEDARKGISDFSIPHNLKNELFPFQEAAVSISARYIMSKGGVFIGDVVGLGKTLMAVAVAKILEEEYGYQTLVLCPKNLEEMWNDYRDKYALRGRVLPVSTVQTKLPKLERHHIVIIDESHNLRNPNGKRYGIIKDYIDKNDCKCILLSATPYNKTYTDLSSQLALFLDIDEDLGVKPDHFLKSECAESFQGSPSSLKAFEQSESPEDWQQLMTQFLVRRTRSFIKENYGKKDPDGKVYLEFSNGDKSYFPKRIANTIEYQVDEQYRKFFSTEVVDIIHNLKLSRYALHEYKKPNLKNLSQKEEEIFKDLKQGRSYPMGFCRINLFKRLESSGYSFLRSIQRHILRNCIFIYAIESKNELMVRETDNDIISSAFESDDDGGITGFSSDKEENFSYFPKNYESFYKEAKKCYQEYRKRGPRSIKWISSSYFTENLKKDLKKDTKSLISLLKNSSDWNPSRDLKLKKLESLIKKDFKGKKALVFSQSKETANYLYEHLEKRNIKKLGIVTGETSKVQSIIRSFSPKSNKAKINKDEEIDVLITTDVLSEGQNLQDCHIIINYDLPWAIIKLVQRVGRVDRIGQESDEIKCCSFMPAKGVEDLIKLKSRIKSRLKENAEVVGTDEKFFDDDEETFKDLLYNEKSSSLEKELFKDIDPSSNALQIWKNAIKKTPQLEDEIKNMPNVVHSSKKSDASKGMDGILLFAKSHITNYLIHLNNERKNKTENHVEILKMAECSPKSKALKRTENHYELVKESLKLIQESVQVGGDVAGRFGGRRSPRYRLYKIIEELSNENSHRDFHFLANDLYNYPLLNDSERILNKMFRTKESSKKILDLALERYKNENLLNKKERQKIDEQPRIVCSMGLIGD